MWFEDEDLYLYNTLQKKVVLFEPLKADHVGLYVCGPTVYDRIHIGNGRPLVVFDVLVRLLRQKYASVVYVRNLTDVDDKIIDRARDLGISEKELTRAMEAFFLQDSAALGVLEPTAAPRATDCIGEMIAFIKGLLDSGAAYCAENHVLFSVASLGDSYGKLSGRQVEDQLAGARVKVESYKRAPADFILWKPAQTSALGWESPWGYGRPGWHIECSAMSEKYLGRRFDIHGGGQDLLFPHHENERAQNIAFHKNKAGAARFWVHNGLLTIDGQKMSKAAGNILSIDSLLQQWPAEAIRFHLLSSHYREPMDFTRRGLLASAESLRRFYDAFERSGQDLAPLRRKVEACGTAPSAGFKKALAYDLNTPKALAALFDDLGRLNQALHEGRKAIVADLCGVLLAGGAVLGLFAADPQEYLRVAPSLAAAEIEALIAARQEARQGRRFEVADRIRRDLEAYGIHLKDTEAETLWHSRRPCANDTQAPPARKKAVQKKAARKKKEPPHA